MRTGLGVLVEPIRYFVPFSYKNDRFQQGLKLYEKREEFFVVFTGVGEEDVDWAHFGVEF